MPFLFLLLQGCHITTGSFNHGKLLNPGERIATYAVGGRYASTPIKQWEWDDSLWQDVYKYDSTRYYWTTFCYNYRVGILRKYPFGRGLEAGFHLETGYRMEREVSEYDTLSYPEFYTPPLLEVDTRFGLPDFIIRKGILHHNVSAGWLVGYWVDNGWFIGYNAGWEFEKMIPYAGIRFYLSPTDAQTSDPTDEDFFTRHDRHFGMRLTTGTSIMLPSNFSLLPDYIAPEISMAFPEFSPGQNVGISWAIGVRWKVGW